MKILVPIRRIPDPDRTVRAHTDGQLDTAGIPWIIDPYDEAALSHAIDLRSETGGEVIAVAVGECLEQQIQGALALRADRAVHVLDAGQSDLPRFAQLLSALFESEQADLCIVGKQTSDTDDPALGLLLAAMCDVSLATSVHSLSVHGASLRAVRTVRGGFETLDVPTPAVVTVDLRPDSPLTLTLPAILAARSKPMLTLNADTLQPDASLWMKSLRYEPTPARVPGRRVADVNELAALVRDELLRLAPRPRVIDTDPASHTVRRSIFGGRILETVQYSDAAAELLASAEGSITYAQRIEFTPVPHSRPNLVGASVIVAGGRTLGSSENFERLIGGLADALGSAIGATGGAVAVGFASVDHQIGQSGKTVAPDLYIAAGISGADQHVGGMRASKVIVAINSDPSAAIFRIADYALIGNLNDVLPELTAKLNERR